MSNQMLSVATTADVRSAGTPGANTPFFTVNKTLPPRTLRLAIAIQCANDSVVTVTVGGVDLVLRDGNPVLAGNLWECEFGARPGTLNMKINNAGAVQYLSAEIKYGAD